MMLGGGMFLGWIFLLLFLVLIGGVIGGGIWLLNRDEGAGPAQMQQRPAASSEDPLEILRRRYARGEITREEFYSMREDLIA